MIPAAILPLVRRAILDLINDVGGEENDDVLTIMLTGLGHRFPRPAVAEQMRWLADHEMRLLEVTDCGPYTVAAILPNGREVAEGRLKLDGIWRHKTGR
ncbi:hypothetical protein [uncultured Sphingobium sp.]|uniref:hypothetical protein n=1 Tax=uncultured Sphingobium sp. TaxID=316087 RepID=UPI00259AEE62|nr:hypothetical protein [uncultured Sphingobium sp.]